MWLIMACDSQPTLNLIMFIIKLCAYEMIDRFSQSSVIDNLQYLLAL